ncbi:MAG: hypothetical protein HRT57_04385 [Crocinitomicaceae bacterium]|nr:hypothetical protein [Crocinitomicaceae bacterium]
MADSIARVKEIEITDLELKEHKAQIAKDDTQKIALYGGMFFAINCSGTNSSRLYNQEKI